MGEEGSRRGEESRVEDQDRGRVTIDKIEIKYKIQRREERERVRNDDKPWSILK